MNKKPLWWWIATWFGSGLAPKASGTAGSAAALPFAFIIQYCAGNYGLFIASIIIFFVGWWAANEYLKNSGRDDDPKEIVVDEVAGMWLLLSFFTISTSTTPWEAEPMKTAWFYFISFTLFRFFDALKPWPICVADRKIKGGFGVMFDDILAAIYPIFIVIVIFYVYR